MSPDTMLEKQPSLLIIVISCFLVFTDKLHVITSARLFCGLWLLWNTVQTCIVNFWPSWSTCGRRLEKLTKKKQKQKIAKVWYRGTLLVWQYTFYDFQSRAILFDIRLFSNLYIGSWAELPAWMSGYHAIILAAGQSSLAVKACHLNTHAIPQKSELAHGLHKIVIT